IIMAGLNNLISNTAQQTTTLPSWFDTAQQNVVSQAGNALNAAPTPQSTVAQNAVNQLSGPTNAFTQAGGTLQQIASGAANPWITDQATGQVTPDTSTALGGLFQAQNQQHQKPASYPEIRAPNSLHDARLTNTHADLPVCGYTPVWDRLPREKWHQDFAIVPFYIQHVVPDSYGAGFVSLPYWSMQVSDLFHKFLSTR
ncbi:hypothetical protein, partial [Undibacterium luofuense]|uniref:hypothetical protein n=1 Tax=Undibacterium luofuense TaxID=2828733 RepID=UPI0030ED9EA1